MGDVRVEMGGYTDSKGSEKFNQMLSQARAEAVRIYLMGRGISGDRLSAKGYGESNPVARTQGPRSSVWFACLRTGAGP